MELRGYDENEPGLKFTNLEQDTEKTEFLKKKKSHDALQYKQYHC